MKNEWFSYIKIDEIDRCVHTSGITFEDFYNGIENKPLNLLVLSGWIYRADYYYSPELMVEYIPAKKMEEFSKSEIQDFEDFCWLDFDNEENLKTVSSQELAEFLYFSHMVKPMKDFRFKSIGNKYAYWTHDDGWYSKVFLYDTEKYKQIIEYIIRKKLKGRKKTIAPIPSEFMDRIYTLCLDGAVIDFENSSFSGVHIYLVGEHNGMDSIHKKLDQLRTQLQSIFLEYDTDIKKWRIYE